MIDLIQMIVNGIAVGSSYALMGLAMVIIYKTSEVLFSFPFNLCVCNSTGMFSGICHPSAGKRTQGQKNPTFWE